MNSSFYNGVSGIKSHQFGLDVWANNISNISTTGFRSSAPEFSSLFSASLTNGYFNSTSDDKGLGSQAQTTGLNLTQGILESTDNPFDLAISGEGWFGVLGENGETFYTRAGQFSLDADGNMVDLNGNYLLATPGNNLAPATLDQETLDQFGQYYSPITSSYSPATPYSIAALQDVPLGAIGQQTKISLPDLLYYPPIPTQKVSYETNLEPTVESKATMVALNALDYPATITPSELGLVAFNGTIANTPQVLNPKLGDMIFVTLTDINGKKVDAFGSLDEDNNWNIANVDVSDLDSSAPLNVSATIQTTQEVANIEHFATSILSPNGNKDTLDATFTKRVPQVSTGSTWDANVKILSFYETYNPETTYDPTLYEVDMTSKKVYSIIDSQVGVLTFGTAGELISNTIPTLSNSGIPLTLNLGTPGTFDGVVSSTGFSKGNSVSADGFQEGFLQGYGMDGNGNIVAEFSNGKSSAIAKVALYHFQNDQGLDSLTSTLFTASSNSGEPIFYQNEEGDAFLGSRIVSSRLEGSNVSMATALTELIIMQKSFDANAKSITTSDELIKNAINMKK